MEKYAVKVLHQTKEIDLEIENKVSKDPNMNSSDLHSRIIRWIMAVAAIWCGAGSLGT